VGCCALKAFDLERGELKSMHTVSAHRRRGVGRALLDHVVSVARGRAYREIFLGTGASDAFRSTRQFYERCGFVRCGPFGTYIDNAHSAFTTPACKYPTSCEGSILNVGG